MTSRFLLFALVVALPMARTDAEAQRLEPLRLDAGRVAPAMLPESSVAAWQFPQPRRDPCGLSLGATLAIGALGGAAAGWLTYELVLGVWGDGSDPESKRYRNRFMLAGATSGLIMSGFKWAGACGPLAPDGW